MKYSMIGLSNRTKNQVINAVEVDRFLELVGSDSCGGNILRYRELYAELKAQRMNFPGLGSIKDVCAAAEYYKKASGEHALRTYNGVVMLEVQSLSNKYEVEVVKKQSALLPQTMMALEGADGHSVVILVRATMRDGALPKDEEQMKLFHAEAYRVAVLCFSPTLSFPISIKEPKIDGTFKMTVDAEPYMNANAIPFIVDLPKGKIDLQKMVGVKALDNPVSRLKPGSESIITTQQIFDSCYRAAWDVMHERKMERTKMDEVTVISKMCANGGLPEEEATQRLLWHYYTEDPVVVRDVVRTVYSERDDLGTTSYMPKKQVAAIKIGEFLRRRYDIRYNTVLNVMEYRVKHSFDFIYHKLDKLDYNTIRYEAALEGIEAFDSEINGLIESNYTPKFNPIEDFLGNLGEWDGKDRIKELAELVPCENEHWTQLFSRWFLSMVAHWMGYDSEHANSTAPILVGAQGYRKSTFCRILLPPELRMFYTDSIDFRTKLEAERMLNRFLLINIDEYDQLTPAQIAFVKHLFQKPKTNSRDMYKNSFSEKQRYASFIATSNHQDILRDTTGNRRYLCIELSGPIKVETPIDYRQLYAQAVSMIRAGERYWINDEDEALINVSNEEFEVESPLELVVKDIFRPAKDGEECMELRPIDIMQVLRKHPAFNKKEMESLNKLGNVLSKGFKKTRKSKGWYYRLVVVNEELFKE